MTIKMEFKAGRSSEGPAVTQVPEDPVISSDL